MDSFYYEVKHLLNKQEFGFINISVLYPFNLLDKFFKSLF